MTLLNEPRRGAHIVLFDGVCGLCDRFVQFVLPKDSMGKFQFASLQSDFAAALLTNYNLQANELNSIFVIADYELPTQRLLAKSDAAAFVLSNLGLVWSFVALFKFMPKSLRDFGYDTVAANRYKIFGKHDSCRLPDQLSSDRFIEI